ncbi:MAG: sigma-70 family RNA polymerase sigma factor [Anaerolineales bacterium]|jgi:RNA polymerase sigma-70 factor (ECF subfamily)
MLTFEGLYSEYADDVYRFVLWLSSDQMEAEDVTSETFVRVWGHLRSIELETLKGYLLKTARNIYLGRRRKDQRQTVLLESQVDPSKEPEAVVETRRIIDEVWAHLQEQPECDRSALLLRAYYELSYAEIGRILDISEVNARVKVHRVRKQLLLQGLGGRSTDQKEADSENTLKEGP